MEDILIPFGIVAIPFIGLPWLILCYASQRKRAVTISREGENLLAVTISREGENLLDELYMDSLHQNHETKSKI